MTSKTKQLKRTSIEVPLSISLLLNFAVELGKIESSSSFIENHINTGFHEIDKRLFTESSKKIFEILERLFFTHSESNGYGNEFLEISIPADLFVQSRCMAKEYGINSYPRFLGQILIYAMSNESAKENI